MGGLSQTTIPLMTTDWPPPGGFGVPVINVSETVRGGPLTVVNGTSGNPGVLRIQPGGAGAAGAWVDLTDIVSTIRAPHPK